MKRCKPDPHTGDEPARDPVPLLRTGMDSALPLLAA